MVARRPGLGHNGGVRPLPLLLLACETAPPDWPAACAPYAALPEAAALCLSREAAVQTDPARVAALCAQTGAMASDCLRQWVVGAGASGLSVEALLAVCGAHDDCKLAALDQRPAWDVTEQIARCAAAGGAYANDCAVHALHRWLGTLPDAEEVYRVAATPSPAPQAVGMYVAAAVVCGGLPGCAGDATVRDACEKGAAMVRSDPRWCRIGPVLDGDYSLGAR